MIVGDLRVQGEFIWDKAAGELRIVDTLLNAAQIKVFLLDSPIGLTSRPVKLTLVLTGVFEGNAYDNFLYGIAKTEGSIDTMFSSGTVDYTQTIVYDKILSFEHDTSFAIRVQNNSTTNKMRLSGVVSFQRL